MNVIKKIVLHSVSISVLTLAIVACGGGGGDNSAPVATNNTSNNSNTGSQQFLSAGVYPATDGSLYSEFHDLKLEKGGYLDVTTWKATVSLYTTSLGLINNEISSIDYIPKGEYKLKFTYSKTPASFGIVTIFSLDLKDYSQLPSIESKKYISRNTVGRYSEYYKLEMKSGGFIDITSNGVSVHVYNKTKFGGDGMPLKTHYEQIVNNKYLDAGEYIVKFIYYDENISIPNSVSVLIN